MFFSCLLFLAFGSMTMAFAEEACKFSYLGFPEDLHDSSVVVPEDVVAMSEFVPVGTPTQIIEQFVNGSIPSIFFIIDNSSSMNTQYNDMMTANDLLGARFTVTDALIDTLFKKCPKAQIGVAVFGSTLFLIPMMMIFLNNVLWKTGGHTYPFLLLNKPIRVRN